MGNMDLLNLHQPWDCQRFPKSKTICYGGGGGGGGNPISKAIESAGDVISEATPDIKIDPTPPPIKMPKSIADTSLAPIADIGTNIADTLSEAKLPEIAPIKMPTSIADTSLGGIDLSVKGFEEGVKKKGSMISEGWEKIKTDVGEGIEKKKTLAGEGWEDTKKRAKDTWERSDLGKAGGKLQEFGEAFADNPTEAIAKSDLGKSDLGKGANLIKEFVHNPGETLAKSDLGKALGVQDDLLESAVGTVSGALPGEEDPAKGKGTATGTGLSDLQKSQLAKRRQGYGRRQTFLT